LTRVPWNTLVSNHKNAWLTEGLQADFEGFLPIGSKETKQQTALEVKAIFKNYGRGVATSRDAWVYNFGKQALANNIKAFADYYNSEVTRWQREKAKGVAIDDFVAYDTLKMSWSRDLKQDMRRGRYAEFGEEKVRRAMYRPFGSRFLFFDRTLNEEVYAYPEIYPLPETEAENITICVTDIASEKPFMTLATNQITDLHLVGAGASSQCFPLYTYAVGGKIRRDNITDWALGQFQAKYGPTVTKRDIFHYVYALLHHPEYRERYKESLKRELPRLPLVADAHGTVFQTYVTVGAELAALHVGYEDAAEYPLKQVVAKDMPLSWRVTKMRLSADKTAVKINDSLTLTGLPPEVFAYRLGNRSALEWVLDQYQVTTDKRSGLVSDPNRADAPDYIARLVRRVVTVSVETQARVGRLPGL